MPHTYHKTKDRTKLSFTILALNFRAPLGYSAVGKITVIILIKNKPYDLVINLSTCMFIIITERIEITNHAGAGILEGPVNFPDCVTESIAHGIIAATEHCNRLAFERQCLYTIKE